MINIKEILIESFGANEIQEIPLQKRSPKGNTYFTAEITPEGIIVSNLGTRPLVRFSQFELILDLLVSSKNNEVLSGNDYAKRPLGEILNTVNGCLSYDYGTGLDKKAFRYSSAMNNILVWCGVCEYINGGIKLINR